MKKKSGKAYKPRSWLARSLVKKASARPGISRIVIRTYSDSGQKKVYCEWTDNARTEGPYPPGAHMQALIDRARRENRPIVEETW